jgi:hypothetical protein
MGGYSMVIPMENQMDLESRIRKRGVIISAETYNYAEIEDAGEPNVLEINYDFYERRYKIRFVVLKDKVEIEERYVVEPDGSVFSAGAIFIPLDEFRDEVLKTLEEDLESNDIAILCDDIKGIITRYF